VDGSRFVLSTPHGDAEVNLPLAGRHNIANALAAASIALALDVPLDTIAAGLEQVPGVAGRLQLEYMPGQWTLIDDSYNANPGSVGAAIDTLALADGERWLVLGDMAELGENAVALHAGIGERARQRGIDRLFAVGPLSAAAVKAFGERGQHLADKATLVAALKQHLHGGVTCLVKGSRSAGMDQVVAALRNNKGKGEGASDAA
jgi:UDP-N-acetylmuramoyl-tripeptide--D-alanyl-D-alanine ligase